MAKRNQNVALVLFRLGGMLFFCFLFLTVSGVLKAQDLKSELFDEASSEADFFRAEELVVTTASRYEQDIDEAPSNITVWTREDIRRSGARTIADLLEGEVGVHVPITEESIRSGWIRGVRRSRNNRILLLIDGVPIQDGVYAQAFIGEEIPIHQVEQIEFIRGPGSAMYGANAFSGVINLRTIDGAELDGKQMELTVGSRDYRKINYLAGGKKDLNFGKQKYEADYTVYGRYFKNHGHGGQLRPNEDVNNPRNWRRGKNFSGGMRLNVGNFELKADVINYGADRIDGLYESNDGHNMRVDDIWNYRYFNQHYAAGWDRDYEGFLGSENFNLDLQLNYNHYDHPGLYTFNDTQWVKPEKISSRTGFNFQGTNRWADGSTLVTGFDLGWNRIKEAQDYFLDSTIDGEGVTTNFRIEPRTYYIHGYYGQYTEELTSINSSLTLGGRYDDHEIMGGHFSPRAGFVTRPSESDLIKLMYGEAFRAPSARELLVQDNVDWTSGNPELDPEIIETLELQYERDLAESLKFDLSAYQNEVEDFIQSDTGSSEFSGEFYNNAGSQESLGLETGLEFTLDRWQVDVDYSRVDAESVKDPADTALEVTSWGIPEQQANLAVTYRPVKQLWFNFDLRHVGDQARSDWTDLEDLDSYQVVDFTLGTENLIESVNTELTVNNLLDEDFYWVDTERRSDLTYPGPGREFRLSVEYQF